MAIHNEHIEGLDRLLKKLEQIGEDSMKHLTDAGKTAMIYRVRGPCVIKCPVGVSGELRASYLAEGKKDRGTRVETVGPQEADVIFGTHLKYGRWVEFGSGPHQSSTGSEKFIEDITKWAAKKGIEDPWPLIWHIRHHGTKPHPHLRPAWDQGKPKLRGDISRYLNTVLKRYTV